MAPISDHDTPETNDLLARAAGGDREAVGLVLARDRDRLRRMVALRLDRRLNGRVDPSDVIQEAQLEAGARLAEFLSRPAMPFFVWLRLITGQCLKAAHRRHLGARLRDAGRDAGREMSLDRPAWPQATSAALAARLLGRTTSPSAAAVRGEMKARLREALDLMDPIDREVLTLRHFEQLTAAEAALELGISEEAAKKRHVRALKRLKAILTSAQGGPGASDL